MRHMRSSCQFAIMSQHAAQKNYHEVCTTYLLHYVILSIDSGKGSRNFFTLEHWDTSPQNWQCPFFFPITFIYTEQISELNPVFFAVQCNNVFLVAGTFDILSS